MGEDPTLRPVMVGRLKRQKQEASPSCNLSTQSQVRHRVTSPSLQGSGDIQEKEMERSEPEIKKDGEDSIYGNEGSSQTHGSCECLPGRYQGR